MNPQHDDPYGYGANPTAVIDRIEPDGGGSADSGSAGGRSFEDGPEMELGRTVLMVFAVAVIAAILAAMLFLFVRGRGDSQAIDSAQPAAGAEGAGSADPAGAQQAAADGSAEAVTGVESPLPLSDPDADPLSDPESDPESESMIGGEESAGDPLVVTTDGQAATTQPSTSMADSTAPSTTVAATTTSTTAAPPSTAATTTPATAPPTTAPPTTMPATTATTTVPRSTQPPGPSGGDAQFQQEILNLTNAERASAGCGPVVLDATLNSVADAHSEDMAANNYFDHTGRDGSQPWDRVGAAGYPASGSGENIAQGYNNSASVMEGWMTSPGHRRNILNCSWTELGVGYATGSSSGNVPGIYWTQVFATRR